MDRYLELCGAEREYAQLHRDSTVSSLTATPTLEDGILRHEDAPLVRAALHGRVCVLDEADEMLNMGFYEDITEILSHSPKDKSKKYMELCFCGDQKHAFTVPGKENPWSE